VVEDCGLQIAFLSDSGGSMHMDTHGLA